MKKVIFFDLDNTLIKFDESVFVKKYLYLLSASLAPHGYNPEELAKNVWSGTLLMMKNDGKFTNERVFWDYFKSIYGEKIIEDYPLFDKFYAEVFDNLSPITQKVDGARELIEFAKNNFEKVVLSTNPFFPRIATEKRVTWAGLNPKDFDYITSYENSSFCKPNPAYYEQICQKLSLDKEDVIMVGNNDLEDYFATSTLNIPCIITEEERIVSDKVTGVVPIKTKKVIEELKKYL